MDRAGRRDARLVVLALILVLQVASGCAALGLGGPDPRDRLAPDEAMPSFWHVTGGTGAELYLLGSVHMGPATGWIYAPQIDAAFARSSAVVVELDPRDISAPLQQALVARYGMLTPTERLSDYLSPETLALLEQQLARSGLPRETMMRMQPWMLGNVLVLEAARRAGYSPSAGVDLGFLARAGSKGVVALESAEYQMSLLSRMSPEVQELTLLDTLNRGDAIEDYIVAMVEAWRKGDEKALEELLFESYEDDPAFAPFFEQLFFRRNYEMTARLEVLLRAEQHAGESVFAIVGAGHLLGDRSIRALLHDDGFEIEEVELDPPRPIELAGEDRAPAP